MAKRKMTIGNRIKAFFGGVPIVQNIDWYDGSGGGLNATEYKDKTAQLNANVGWVFSANQVIADECSRVRIKLIHKQEDGDDEEVFNHPVLDLLNNPNAALTSKQLWNLYYSYLNLTGEAYILKLDRSGKPLTNQKELPTALYPLPSHLVQFNLNEFDLMKSTITYAGNTYPLTAVLRDINPDPENFYQGMSIVRKASLTIDTDIQMKRWNNKMFKNNGRPGSVVSFPQALSDDDYKRAKQMFNEQYSGTGNAFRNIILDNGATVTPYMMSQQDLDFLASKAFTRDEILAMFKVSTSNLGIVEDTNRASATTQEYGFRKRCVVPRLEQFKDFINMRLLNPIYHGEYMIDFEDVLPEDTERKLNEANAGINKWLTIDEVREMYDLEPLPNGLGEKIYANMGLVPLDELSMLNEREPTTPQNEPERPSDGEDEDESDQTPETPQNAPETPEMDIDPEEAKAIARKKIGDEKADRYEVRRKKYIKMLSRTSRKMFNEQKADAIKWIDENSGELKSINFKKGWADEIINWSGYKKDFAKSVNAILSMIVEEVGTDEFNRLIAIDDDRTFNPYETSITNYLKDNAMRNSKEVNDETRKQLQATLKEGISLGETIEKLKTRVMSVFGTASTERAYTIALTESANAQNYADVEAWKQCGGVIAKEWYSAEDVSVCGFCRPLDGKRIKLDEEFYEKGERATFTDAKGHEHTMKLDYRSIGEPPLHPNCRCVLLPVMEDE